MPSPRRQTPSTATRMLRRGTLALLLITPLVRAGNLQVAPILLEFSDSQQAQVLWLENTGDQAMHAQVRVQRWTQPNATDVLEPSTTLLASPAIIQIGAGQRQLVRLVRPTPLPSSSPQEQAYRLLVDELPSPHDTSPQGLQFLLRYSIPVFILPTGALPRELGNTAPVDQHRLQAIWQVEAGQLSLTLRNTGAQRIRLSQLRWLPEVGPAIDLTPGLLGYVLAGQQMHWTLPFPSPLPPAGTLQARLNDAALPQPLHFTGL